MNTKRAKGFYLQSIDKEETGPFTDLFTPFDLAGSAWGKSSFLVKPRYCDP